jgi:hypothetical protein
MVVMMTVVDVLAWGLMDGVSVTMEDLHRFHATTAPWEVGLNSHATTMRLHQNFVSSVW